MPSHVSLGIELEAMELTPELRAEIADLSDSLQEPWQEVLTEALSELRSLRWQEIGYSSSKSELATSQLAP